MPAGTTFVDTLDGDQVFNGTPVFQDTAGNPIDSSLYTISYSADKKQMIVVFPNGLDKQIKVAYQSQITKPIEDGDQTVYKNTATSNEESSTANSGKVKSQGLVKSLADVDYTNRVAS